MAEVARRAYTASGDAAELLAEIGGTGVLADALARHISDGESHRTGSFPIVSEETAAETAGELLALLAMAGSVGSICTAYAEAMQSGKEIDRQEVGDAVLNMRTACRLLSA